MDRRINPVTSIGMHKVVMGDYYAAAKRAHDEGKLVAWCTGVSPAELLRSFDVVPVFPENHAAMCGARKVASYLIEEAEAQGYSMDLCSYARIDIGSLLAGENTKSPIGGLPKPDFVVAANASCVTVQKWYEALGRLWGVPVIVLDIPFNHNIVDRSGIHPDALGYLVAQMHEMVAFLEQQTRRKFDYARFQESIALSRQAAEAWAEALRLCEATPSPLNMFEGFIAMGPIVAARGTPETVKYYQDIRAEVAERVAQGVAAVPGERFRLFWDNIPLWYRVRETAEQLAAHGACVVAATYPQSWSFQYLDPDRPFETLAEALNLVTVNWGVKQRSAKMRQVVQQFACDGLIMHSARTCKAYFIGQYDIRNAIEREFGVPGLVIDADHTDPRAFSETQVAARIDAFMESLAARRPAQV